MRNAFAQLITDLAADDPRIVMLSGDIGNRLFNDFKRRCPDRFFNCGIAEQSMISMAAGLAMSGLKPVAYTITPFITTRCLEQIRVDLCYHELAAVIVGVGAGLSYASLGATHHACEDIAMMRALPGMTVVCPGDAHEVRAALRASLANAGPVYLRLGKKGEPVVHESEPALTIGKAIVVRQGRDVCLLSTGNSLPIAVQAAQRLDDCGTSARVVSMHTVKPLDEALLAEVFSHFPLVVTIEEHSIVGGLGGAVAEWLCDQAHGAATRGSAVHDRARLLRIGTPDAFLHETGDQAHARQFFGLTPEAITRRVQQAMASAQMDSMPTEAMTS